MKLNCAPISKMSPSPTAGVGTGEVTGVGMVRDASEIGKEPDEHPAAPYPKPKGSSAAVSSTRTACCYCSSDAASSLSEPGPSSSDSSLFEPVPLASDLSPSVSVSNIDLKVPRYLFRKGRVGDDAGMLMKKESRKRICTYYGMMMVIRSSPLLLWLRCQATGWAEYARPYVQYCGRRNLEKMWGWVMSEIKKASSMNTRNIDGMNAPPYCVLLLVRGHQGIELCLEKLMVVVANLVLVVMKACVHCSMEWDDQREVVEPLVDGDVEEVDDLSFEAMEDDEVATVDGVFEGAFGALGDEI
uniref:Uncharacterized protein n=1 Tax=Tanacetum cinerariifolium TaxID=118510 RepID=A0A6L2K7J9_TANCI|nr:hypothetical protein [Tanacetum cinerariifolium]